MPFPVDVTQVEATEQRLGARFPQSFRERMMRENGGEVDAADDTWTLNPVLDASDRKRLARTCNDILRETEQSKKWRGWPANALCIGNNGAGDHLVFLLDSGTIGPSVFVWRHEIAELQKVAEDFTELT